MIYKTTIGLFNPQFEVVSCFFEYDGKILLLHRQDDKPWGNKWGVPAGKVDSNETKTDAMVREIKEETGFNIRPHNLRYFDKVNIRHPDSDFVYYMFNTKLDSQPDIVINLNEHKDFRWVPLMSTLNMSLVSDLDECIKAFYLLRYTKELIKKETETACTLSEVRDAIVSDIMKIKDDDPHMRIGYISGIITSDGPGRIPANIARLATYTEYIQRCHDFPVFSASDIFSEELLGRLEANGFKAEDYIKFWREILECRHVIE